ncbi:MAG: ABC transporter permease [Treponema sp.]|nr:ABC transporter permease [Treponema sp.]
MELFFTSLASIFSTPYYFGLMLNTASLFMTAALSAAICIKSGEFNLGAEGQIYAGGFFTAITLSALKNCNPFLSGSLCFLISAVVSGGIALISALLKKYRNASFLLTSFIISAAIVPLIDGLIAGPFRSDSVNLLSTAFIPEKFRFKSILQPSPLNAFFFSAIIFCVAGGFLIYKTSYGKKLCIFGKAPLFARYSGFSDKTILFSASFISGALNGITGAAAVTGTYFTCHKGFAGAFGWNALSVAMIAGSNPFLIIPSSLFLSTILTAADKTSLFSRSGFDISSMIQAVILFLIAIPFTKNITNKIGFNRFVTFRGQK